MLRRMLSSLLPGARLRSDNDIVAASRGLLDAGLAQQAIDLLSPILARDEGHVDALCARGEAQAKLGDFAGARRDLEHAAQRDAVNPRIPYLLAKSYWAENNSTKAAEYCRRSVALGAGEPAERLLSIIELAGDHYVEVVRRIHQFLKPRTYVEVGVFTGATLALCAEDTRAIGVDPEPKLKQPPGPNQRVYSLTSDAFFAGHDVVAELGGPVELAFIDGMHQFEFALRDFINLEKLCTRDSLVMVHDCYPRDRLTAAPEESPKFWSGDIWRLILLLKKYRPDLKIDVIAAPPTGLGIIRNLDPASSVLGDKLQDICREFAALDYSVLGGTKHQQLNLFANDWQQIAELLKGPA
jgi:tetratricopeptide (TPR) repeat protein